jgi:hypothetical protein
LRNECGTRVVGEEEEGEVVGQLDTELKIALNGNALTNINIDTNDLMT